MTALNVIGMQGLGDSIYQRAFVRHAVASAPARPVHLQTSWPELVADLPTVRPVHPHTRLRTQARNVARQPRTTWAAFAPGARTIRVAYGRLGIVPGMAQAFGTTPDALAATLGAGATGAGRVLDLPDLGPSPIAASDGPYAVVRPVTIRTEWRADARNPRPEYVAEAAALLRARGYRVVSVADLAPGREWALEPLPPADVRYHAGELDVRRLLALVRDAVAVVGGIGWLVPAALALQVPAWIVAGGWGVFNAPEQITHPALGAAALACVTFALPDRFCRCASASHACDKTITDYADRLAAWADRLPALV